MQGVEYVFESGIISEVSSFVPFKQSIVGVAYLHLKFWLWLQVTMATLLCLPFHSSFKQDLSSLFLQVKLLTIQVETHLKA